MRKIVLYIAMSLDGYISDRHGGVSWISGDGSEPDHPGSYNEFIETIDTVILGYTTYHQIVTELSPDSWVYDDKMSFVITNRKLDDKKNIKFTDNLVGVVQKLKGEEGKDIWICGGAAIVNQLIAHDLIDRFCITIVPEILGDGTRLFEKLKTNMPLKLISSMSYNGYIDVIYERRSIPA